MKKMKKLKLDYEEVENSIISGLEFAIRCISKIFWIHVSIVACWFTFIGFTYANGILTEPIPKIDFEWLKMMYLLYILGCITVHFIRMISDWFSGTEDTFDAVKGNVSFTDYSEYEDLIGRYFHYNEFTYRIDSYKRILTFPNKESYYSEIAFDVGKFQGDGSLYYTIWNKDELYMALAEDESFQ